tara:strand:+ start:3218 stop:3403 length:186 start_codon:yes stop_codon:yes gene_type:complete
MIEKWEDDQLGLYEAGHFPASIKASPRGLLPFEVSAACIAWSKTDPSSTAHETMLEWYWRN